jgi:Ca-activated chloride channel family protein
MFARLRSPRFEAVRIEWPGGVQPAWVSALPVSVFDADTVNVFALLREVPDGEIRLLGIRPGSDVPEPIGSVRLGAVAESFDALSKIAAHARVAALCAQDVQDPAQARRLALAYQLVTEQTHYLLVVERAEGERATDMPALHKVAQMVPAGWGGTSSVQFDAMRPAPAPLMARTRGMPMAAGAAAMGTPMLRKKLAQAAPGAGDTPATTTPAALGAWLRQTPASAWPTTYAALARQGLPPEVLDWLELAMAPLGGTPRTEEAVVAAFLHLLANVRVFEQPGQPTGVLRGTANAVRRLRDAFAGTPGSVAANVDMRFVEQLAAQLAGITPQRWPDPVYALHANAPA